LKKYVIHAICPDGYDRFAVIKEIEHNVILNVHFLEFSEYIENGETSRKKETKYKNLHILRR